MRARDLTGLRFGHLVVNHFHAKIRTSGGESKRHWNCTCDCGNTFNVNVGALTSGNTTTCGCKMDGKATIHGMWDSRIYQCWSDMKGRCKNDWHKSYHNYGGRGITYDASWETFEVFHNDMRDGYSDDLTLERQDVNLGYNKDNCSWATKHHQSHNRRKISRNSSGVTGVRWTTDRSGTLYAAASAMFPTGAKEKHYSVKKYGLLPAFHLACVQRKKMIEELNTQGAGYTASHGL